MTTPSALKLPGCLLALLLAALATAATAAQTNYLSDWPELIRSYTQGWGTLGFDVAADGSPLEIGQRHYAKGLGHHANGAITVALGGNYTAFDAEIGIHKQPSGLGTVIFRVLLDGKQVFNSGIVHGRDPARPIHVEVTGAQEMVLEAGDAGDGISFDMANWAEARLTGPGAPPALAKGPPVDVSRFGRVVSWDPNRKDGCRSDRVQEFRAEDLFLETDVPRASDGTWTAAVSTNGLSCIGLQWLNRRALRELVLHFAPAGRPGDPPQPSAPQILMESWEGESAWQGHWQPLKGGQLSDAGDAFVWRGGTNGAGGLVQTRKIRWIFPASLNPVKISQFTAWTHAHWGTVSLRATVENLRPGRGQVEVRDGEFADGNTGLAWDLSQPLLLQVRSARQSLIKSELTALHFQLPSGPAEVAVQDVLDNGCVYLPDRGLFVTTDPPKTNLAECKAHIAQYKSVLERVREMPDQEFAQAMAKTHDPIEDSGPVLLSLACDNVKFVVAREGTVQFETDASANKEFGYLTIVENWFAIQGEVRPRFGKGRAGNFKRRLEEHWLPVPIISVEKGGILYSQRTFVAPCDDPGADPARLNRKSVCVIEFTAANAGTSLAEAALALAFVADTKAKKPAQLTPTAHGFAVSKGDRGLAVLDASGAGTLAATAANGSVTFAGQLGPGQTARWTVLLPGVGMSAGDLASVEPPAQLRTALAAYWKAVLAPAMQVEIPDPLLSDIIASSRLRCLIDARNEAGGSRIAPWTAAMAYGPLESESHSFIRGMDFLGHEDFARRSLDFFVHRYNRAGFLTTGYTTFGTGWHLWTLGEHFRLDRDVDWLERVGPEVARLGEWVVAQTEKTRKTDAAGAPRPEYGLMPPGVLADWNAFAYHFCLSAYYYAGLREAGAALDAIGNPKGAMLVNAATELRGNLLRAYRWTQSQTPAWATPSGAWIAAYPSQLHSPGKLGDFFPGQDAGRSGSAYEVELGAHQLVTAGVLDAASAEVTQMLDHMEDVQYLADGWVNFPAAKNRQDWFDLGGFSKTQPYYTRNAEIYAMRDEVKPFIRSYFNTIASEINPEVLTVWEGLAGASSGAWDKTHETGYFLQQTRFMLVKERGEELWLAPFVPRNWLKDELSVATTNAPTFFGKVSYRIRSHAAEGWIEAALHPPTRRAPKALVLRLRHPEGKPMRSVTVNGRPHADFDPQKETIRIVPEGPAPILVRASF